MIRAAAFIAALLLAAPLAAQTEPPAAEGAPEVLSEREQVLLSFRQLVDRGDARALFGLPEKTFWRREDGLTLALFAEEAAALEPLLRGAAAPFAEATGQGIAVAEAAPLPPEADGVAALAPQADLVIVIAPRPRVSALATAAGVNPGMLAQFEYGSWPFVFSFEEDAGRRGILLLAAEEPARAREASFILATVWGLGGVTLGPELDGLVSDSAAGPQLTPVGRQVFALFYHPQLAVGMPIDGAVRRAAELLPR